VDVSIRVLVVDDSALMRALLTEMINGAPDLEVVGAAPDPIAAREMIKEFNPDVMTLDVEMPRMDGLDFLDRVMRLRPMPVIMISSMTGRGSEITLKALELGAVDFVAKPRAENISMMQGYTEEICDKIRAAHSAKLKNSPARTAQLAPAAAKTQVSGLSQRVLNETIIAIGASTGGTEAIKDVLVALPGDLPPIVMTQHMPETFTPSFAKRLDDLSALTVSEAKHGDRLAPGHAYLAPGHSHLLLKRFGAGYVCELNQGEPVNRHRPSVDVMFRSVAEQAKGAMIGVILTGMGKDGAQGLLTMRNAGAHTIGQDQASCVVYGMPREAAQVGGVIEVCSLDNVAGAILNQLKRLDRH
jgi:two-component system, chemotaxis family, protein-glutamate methylesterase/glutaminase